MICDNLILAQSNHNANNGSIVLNIFRYEL